MAKGSADTLHLSVRQARQIERSRKIIEEEQARIASLEKLGTKSVNKLCKDAAKTMATQIKETLAAMQIPATLIRKTTAMAVHMAIPKSPRGRKPMEAQEEKAA